MASPAVPSPLPSAQPAGAAARPTTLGGTGAAAAPGGQRRRRRQANAPSYPPGAGAAQHRQLLIDLPSVGLALPSAGGTAPITPMAPQTGAGAAHAAAPERTVAATLTAPGSAQPSVEPLPAEQRLLASVLSLLEAGTSPWRREWDSSGGGHHLNLVNGHRYRGVNPILLTLGLQARQAVAVGLSELSDLPYWCGYAAAKALGLHPRAGSRAVHILRPHRMQRRGATAGHPEIQSGPTATPQPREAAELPRDNQEAPAGQGSWIRYRPVAVFHVSDLEGEGLAALVDRRRNAATAAMRPEPERLELADMVLSRWPVPLVLGGAAACYVPALDRIQLPERGAFHSAAAFYATWAHEAVHSTGHGSRLNRDLSGRMGGEAAAERTYAREELVAELGALLIGDRLEIGSDTANHAAYLSHWIALLQDSPRLLYQVLAEARRAADLVAPEQEPPADGSTDPG